MFLAVSSLPALTPESTAALTQLPLADPGKRPWETNKSAYFEWATKQLLARIKQQASGTEDTTIAALVKFTDTIANSRDMNTLMQVSAGPSGRQERGAEGK